MEHQFIAIARRSDGDLARAVASILSDMPQVQVTYDWPTNGTTQCPFSDLANDVVWQTLAAANGTAIQQIRFLLPGYQVAYGRGGIQGQNWPTIDQVQLSVSQDGASPEQRLASLKKIYEQFPPVALRTTNAPPFEEDELRAIEQSRLQRLTELTERFFEQGLQYKSQLEADHAAKLKSVEEQLASGLEKVQQLGEQRSQELDHRAHELERRRQELDDKDNTHARRGIREKMLQDIKERVDSFGVSRSTSQKRLPVMIGMWFLIFFLLLSAYWTAIQLDRGAAGTVGSAEHWLVWARLGLSTAGLIAGLLYYIKWEDSWARKHAEAELSLRQFQIDLNRASWVVETCLEWKKDSEGQIPVELLKAITNGLFDSAQSSSEPVLHPADELASALLGSASKLKLKTPGGELEFNTPGKIPKEAPASRNN